MRFMSNEEHIGIRTSVCAFCSLQLIYSNNGNVHTSNNNNDKHQVIDAQKIYTSRG